MATVKELLTGKDGGLLVAAPDTTVLDAAEQMNTRGTGSVLVMEGGKLSGIFTERDLMRRVVRQGRDPKATAMSAVMSPEVRQVPASESIVETLRIMVEHGYRHMLVSQDGKPAGVVSIRDLMRWLILPDAPIAHEGRRGEIRTRALDAVETLKQG